MPWKVLWWALRKLGVEEWIVWLVQGMYANAWSHVRVGEGYSEELEVKVGVYQGSVLSPLLFASLSLKPIHASFALGYPGRTSVPMILLSWLNNLRNVSGGSWLRKKQWRRKDWEYMQERQRSWSLAQASFYAPSVALEWAATASSATTASTRCTSNAVGSSAWQRTLITDVHGAR